MSLLGESSLKLYTQKSIEFDIGIAFLRTSPSIESLDPSCDIIIGDCPFSVSISVC